MAKKKTTVKRKAPAATPPAIPTLGYVILTSLAHHPHTGYELTQLMGPPRNYMWEAKHSQVYPTLQLLAEHGYVTFEDIAQESKPDKKVYEVTERGLEALKEWARKGPTHVPVRDEFSVKMAALRLLPPSEAVAVLNRQIELVEGEIAAINLHLVDFVDRFRLPEPAQSNHRQFCLLSAIRLSRDLKLTAMEAYRKLAGELSRATEPAKASRAQSK
ncbi:MULTISPECIES: PadR family transcriptional regulator [Bradyrhizobium]|nr:MULTISPECIES: PadR family transcriptional regulator [Bradyrhizobium]MCG2628243.1 PadR family transcriptional regulator [Bradyrhizobium zhengyangense]MCG2643362.1 PadR family transcriptional regulator [Bradyrhizobium zhengyangense]MCG2670324.1 PadR family transcriptional regulator [Bradyrhizobium zhengyangense]MDN4985942.1 PadR family transcriptional regulator [Bradyrhizobium sp. WYCCWR 13022]MDN5002678.1 PadR family transcriptional regulator [Bradyrhizobium sp. WYCCWR 12677]